MAKTKIKISPTTRARLLFLRELEIDLAGHKNLISKEILNGLVLQKATFEKQRDVQIRALVLCTFTLLFIQNGGDIRIPGFNILISEVPAIELLLVSIGAFIVFMTSLTFINVSSYESLIDQYSNLYSGAADQEIFSASLSPQWLALKVLRRDFNFGHKVHVTPERVGSFHLMVSEKIISSVLMLLIAIIYFYLLYYAVIQLENTISGLVVKSVSAVVIIFSIYLSWVSNAEFEYLIEENDGTVTTQDSPEE